jgi:hypothetical protein
MMVEETVYQLREITMGDQSGDRKIWTPSGESAAKAFDKISRVYQAVKGYMPPDYIQRSAAMKDFPNRSRQMVLGANELAYSLFEEIKHGDAKHQEWLEEALFCWFNGQPVPKLEKS